VIVSPGHAREWAEVPLTRRARRQRQGAASAPFKTVRRALVQNFAFPSFSSSHVCPLRSELFYIIHVAAACASIPPKASLPRYQTGHAPMFPASSSSALLKWDNFLRSPPPSSGGFPMSPCRIPPRGMWCHSLASANTVHAIGRLTYS
jgi:hypothetical protein